MKIIPVLYALVVPLLGAVRAGPILDIEEIQQYIEGVKSRNNRFLHAGLDQEGGTSAAHLQQSVPGQIEFIEGTTLNGLRGLEASRILDENCGESCLAQNPLLQDQIGDLFPACKATEPSCEGQENSYRTADGSCNNLRYPTWGQANRPQKRLLDPDYSDNRGAPRKSKNGTYLPSTRHISNKLFRDPAEPGDTLDSEFSYYFMQYGQFLDHDLALTPTVVGSSGASLDCCKTEKIENRPEYCFPIAVPDNDPYFSERGIQCINMVRSAPADLCPPFRRQQLNVVTSYIDGSMIYGSSPEQQAWLRAETDGLMKIRASLVDSQVWLPSRENARDDACVFDDEDTTSECVKAGDVRVNVNPTLTTIHTIWLREHNRCARELKKRHGDWDNERLFQECRKLIGAILQHVTYQEYLPIVLGDEIMRRFGLYESSSTFSDVYDMRVDATSSNSFNAAAFRFGHTNIRAEQIRLLEDKQEEKKADLSDVFHRPRFSQEGTNINGMARWMSVAANGKSDSFFTWQVRDLLFKDKQCVSMDLPAINSQRGRDHGLPDYNTWRKFCKLPTFNGKNILTQEKARAHHTLEVAQKLKELYTRNEDIDLYAGAITETLLEGAQVGPLFACLIATEFKRLKVGDRYFFENPSDHDKVGFTAGQVATIKGYSFSSLICKNTDMQSIQENVFKQATGENGGNPVKDCSDLPDIDFNLW